MNKITFLASSVLCLLLGGCITITDSLVVQPNLHVQRVLTMDTSELAYLDDGSDSDEDSFSFSCDNADDIRDETPGIRWHDVTCAQVGDAVIEISGTFELVDDRLLQKTALANGSTLYRYEIDHNSILLMADDDSSDSDVASTEEDEESIDLSTEVTSAFITMTVSVTMPGTIRAAKGATFYSGNKAFFDYDALIEIMKEDGGYIESIVPASSGTHLQSGAEFQQRVCRRVAKYQQHSSVYQRVLRRVENRFGFSCR